MFHVETRVCTCVLDSLWTRLQSLYHHQYSQSVRLLSGQQYVQPIITFTVHLGKLYILTTVFMFSD